MREAEINGCAYQKRYPCLIKRFFGVVNNMDMEDERRIELPGGKLLITSGYRTGECPMRTNLPGEARYFLARTVAGVSCVDYGDSSLVPDPREALDATCP